MAGERDAVLLETVKTHRARLVAAFLFGELDERRVVTGNIRRFVVGLVLAAVACAGCAGTSLVLSVLETQQQQKAASATPTPTPVATIAPATTDPAATAVPVPASTPTAVPPIVAPPAVPVPAPGAP